VLFSLCWSRAPGGYGGNQRIRSLLQCRQREQPISRQIPTEIQWLQTFDRCSAAIDADLYGRNIFLLLLDEQRIRRLTRHILDHHCPCLCQCRVTVKAWVMVTGTVKG